MRLLNFLYIDTYPRDFNKLIRSTTSILFLQDTDFSGKILYLPMTEEKMGTAPTLTWRDKKCSD